MDKHIFNYLVLLKKVTNYLTLTYVKKQQLGNPPFFAAS